MSPSVTVDNFIRPADRKNWPNHGNQQPRWAMIETPKLKLIADCTEESRPLGGAGGVWPACMVEKLGLTSIYKLKISYLRYFRKMTIII